jgi:hypothetical protein
MTNDLHILSDAELDAVIGAGAISDAAGAARLIGAATSAIAGIQYVLTAAVDGIPPAPVHPKA